MEEYRVAQDGTAPFSSVGEALRAISGHEPAVVRIGPGIYREKLFCEKKRLTIIGAGRDRTRLVWGDGALDVLPDGKRGTFRSYTAFFDGESLCLRDLTIENDAGDGDVRGQAVAVALHTRHVLCENAAFLGWQDTLFCAPLPEKERQPRGFLGPRESAPRVQTGQVFRNCVISGTVDFIFGGADALFEDCRLVCRRHRRRMGYIAAPCTPPEALGMVFLRCRVCGEGGGLPGGYALGRPWREHAAAAFVGCRLGACVSPEGFAPWNGPELPDTARFFVAENTGAGATARPRFGRSLTADELNALLLRATALRRRTEAECLGRQ